jgi:hypothetical protein
MCCYVWHTIVWGHIVDHQIWKLSDRRLQRRCIHKKKRDGRMNERTNKWKKRSTICPHTKSFHIWSYSRSYPKLTQLIVKDDRKYWYRTKKIKQLSLIIILLNIAKLVIRSGIWPNMKAFGSTSSEELRWQCTTILKLDENVP